MKSELALFASMVVVSVLAGCDRSGTAPSKDRPRTVVLVTLDTFRCDRIGCYGGKPELTPRLDALAAKGVRFERCLSVAPITLPAHASILSGVDPIAHGIRVNGTGTFPGDLPALQTVLRDEGYATGAFVSASVLDRRYGLSRGFDRYDDRVGGEDDVNSEERRGEKTVAEALRFLDETGSRPAFLWVHLFDAHAEYAAPSEFAARHTVPYEAEMAYVDHCVGLLVDGLASRGRGDPLISVVADHGEGLGDHGESTHTIFVYDTTIHVPWLISGPGVAGGSGGRVVRGTVSMISVAPTLLELIGIDRPDSMYGPALAAAMRDGSSPPDHPARFESIATEFFYGFAPLSGLEQAGLKLIVAPRAELYEPRSDPPEVVDLFEPRRKDADALKRALDALERERERERPPPREPSSAEQEELKQIGYLPLRDAGRGRDAKDGIDEVERLIRAQLKADSDPVGALRDLDAFLKGDDGVAEAHELVGDCAMRISNVDRAVESYRKAIGLRGDDAGLWVKLAEAKINKRPQPDVEGAVKDLTVALEKEPGHVDARIKLVAIRLRLPNADAASLRKDVERVLQGDPKVGVVAAPDQAAAWLVRGQAALSMGDAAAAHESLERAMALSIRAYGVLWELSDLALALQDVPRAVECLNRCLAILRRASPPHPHIPTVEQKLRAIGG